MENKKLKKCCAAAMLLAATVSSLHLCLMPAFAEGEETTIADTTNPENSSETSATEAPKPEELYRFEINTAGRAEIYDFIPSDTYKGALEIPAQLDGCDVGYIGNAAFMNATGITSVTIPATVTDIGNSVFFGCTSLEKFNVQSGNTYLSIADDGVLYADEGKFLVAYPAAKAGESYTIPDAVDEIAPGCFGFAKNLKEMTIPAHVNFVDSWCFAYSNLEKVSIASANLDEYAFAYCEKLSGLELQSGVETVSDAAFSNCPALEQVTLPDTLTTIGQYAFCGTAMKSVTIPANVNEISYGAFGYNADMFAISDFTVYGYPGTAGQTYCTEEDPENDYKNDFTFVDLSETPEATAENLDVVQNSDPDAESNAEPDKIIPETVPDEDLTDLIGVEVKDNQFLRILLATVGGIALILAIALVVLAVKKPKNQKKHHEEE